MSIQRAQDLRDRHADVEKLCAKWFKLFDGLASDAYFILNKVYEGDHVERKERFEETFGCSPESKDTLIDEGAFKNELNHALSMADIIPEEEQFAQIFTDCSDVILDRKRVEMMEALQPKLEDFEKHYNGEVSDAELLLRGLLPDIKGDVIAKKVKKTMTDSKDDALAQQHDDDDDANGNSFSIDDIARILEKSLDPLHMDMTEAERAFERTKHIIKDNKLNAIMKPLDGPIKRFYVASGLDGRSSYNLLRRINTDLTPQVFTSMFGFHPIRYEKMSQKQLKHAIKFSLTLGVDSAESITEWIDSEIDRIRSAAAAPKAVTVAKLMAVEDNDWALSLFRSNDLHHELECGFSYLMLAVGIGEWATRTLLQHRVNVNTVSSARLADYATGFWAAHFPRRIHYKQRMDHLANEHDLTALMLCVLFGDQKTLKRLLSRRHKPPLDVSARSSGGHSAMWFAVNIRRCRDIQRLLLKYGAGDSSLGNMRLSENARKKLARQLERDGDMLVSAHSSRASLESKYNENTEGDLKADPIAYQWNAPICRPPEKVKLFHLSTSDQLPRIRKKGHLVPSVNGPYGPGVYLHAYIDIHDPYAYGDHTGTGDPAILDCGVDLGWCKQLEDGDVTLTEQEATSWISEGFDSVHCGNTWVIRNPANITIRRLRSSASTQSVSSAGSIASLQQTLKKEEKEGSNLTTADGKSTADIIADDDEQKSTASTSSIEVSSSTTIIETSSSTSRIESPNPQPIAV